MASDVPKYTRCYYRLMPFYIYFDRKSIGTYSLIACVNLKSYLVPYAYLYLCSQPFICAMFKVATAASLVSVGRNVGIYKHMPE